MFENCGEKLRGIAMALFIIEAVVALITLIGAFALGTGLLGIISAVVMLLSAWVGAISMSALGEAAESAKDAAYASQEALNLLRRHLDADASGAGAAISGYRPGTAGAGANIPTWKRIQLEEAASGDASQQ